jgi:hypothetical protein
MPPPLEYVQLADNVRRIPGSYIVQAPQSGERLIPGARYSAIRAGQYGLLPDHGDFIFLVGAYRQFVIVPLAARNNTGYALDMVARAADNSAVFVFMWSGDYYDTDGGRRRIPSPGAYIEMVSRPSRYNQTPPPMPRR